MSLAEIRAEVAGLARVFDETRLSPADAETVVRDAAATLNMVETIKALAAKRAAEGGQWRRAGACSPAHDLARKTGSSVARAQEALDTAGALGSLPDLDAAARRGELSPSQTAPIADAASKAPGAERRLLDKARRSSVGELRDECARTKAAAEPDDEARHRAIHHSRFLRRRRCADGAAELQYHSTVDEVATILAVVEGHANRLFDLARLEGRREPEEAYLADGLLAAVTAGEVDAARDAGPATDEGGGGRDAGRSTAKRGRVRRATPTKIVVRIDWDALLRGWPIDAEVSEIAGLGPVPVSVVRAMMASGDAFLAGVVTKGVDVATVFHLGRRPTAHQTSALDWLASTCATEGCNATDRLETDHREDWSATKVTLLRWLERHCHRCHDRKSRLGWSLVDGHGKRPMVPPDDPRHPRHGGAQPRAG